MSGIAQFRPPKPGQWFERVWGDRKVKRLIAILIASIAFMNVSCEAQVKIGNAEVTAPSGWRKIANDKERINFLSPDERQQATISVMRFESGGTFEDFKRLCEHRIKAEKTEAPEALISTDEPFVDTGTFGMFFSGNEKATGRLFSGYLTQKDREMVTIYVESIGVDSKRHLQTFEQFIKGLKRR